MKELSHILNNICSELGISDELKLNKIKSKWKEIAGEWISMHSEPWRLKDGILTLTVDSPEWMQEIKLHEVILIEKIDDFAIKEIKLRLGKITRHHGIRGKITKKRDLNKDESEYIERVTSVINDDGLRYSLRKAMEKAFIHIKKIKIQDDSKRDCKEKKRKTERNKI